MVLLYRYLILELYRSGAPLYITLSVSKSLISLSICNMKSLIISFKIFFFFFLSFVVLKPYTDFHLYKLEIIYFYYSVTVIIKLNIKFTFSFYIYKKSFILLLWTIRPC